MKREISARREILEWIITIIMAVVLAALINLFLIVNALVPSASMEPTIMTRDRVIGFRLAYNKNTPPARGDIVIFKYPDDESVLFIKRIIGLPGETLEIKSGKVYINNSSTPLDEPYLQVVPTGDYASVQIPEDSYFMMGDNRNYSADSRYWTNTFVHREKIVGKALFCYFPSIHKVN